MYLAVETILDRTKSYTGSRVVIFATKNLHEFCISFFTSSKREYNTYEKYIKG